MFEPGWILIGFIEDRLGDTKQFNQARLRPIPIFYGTPNFPIIIVQTKEISPSQTSMAATNMFEPGWFLIGFIDDRLGDTKQFNPARLKPIPIFYGTPNFPIFCVQTINSSPNQTSMAATNMFEPGWILIGFIEDRLGDTKQFNPARLRLIPIFYGTPNFPIFCVQTINSSPSQTSMAATYMFEPGWILIGFIEDRLGDSKQFNQARLRPIPIFYGTPNFPIIIVQTKEISPSQTSMAATNMFEPGWFLIGFIDDRLGDTKQFNPARLRPIPIFYGTPNFPIFCVQTINSSPTQTSMAATNMFEPGWILIGFIEDRLKTSKTSQTGPAQTNSHFLWDAKLPYNHCSNTKFFFNSNFHGGYKYVWAGLNPDWFHWGSSRGHKTIQSSPAQTHSHLIWDAKFPYILQSDNKFFSISNFHGGYIYVWAGLNPDWFHWGSSRGHKTIQSSPAQTHSHLIWDAKFPYISSIRQ